MFVQKPCYGHLVSLFKCKDMTQVRVTYAMMTFEPVDKYGRTGGRTGARTYFRSGALTFSSSHLAWV